ncbi:MAG: ABC transporter substrate-binding protein [Flavobacteriaceae bacterium]
MGRSSGLGYSDLRTVFGRAAGVAALIATGLVAFAGQAAAQGDPIKIGLVYAKQGPFALFGNSQAEGAKFAAQQAGMKVMGRPIEVIWYDEADPNDAQQNFTKLVEQDGVVAVIGGTNSATALALSATAGRLKTPLVLGAGSATDITGSKCNRYTFRSSYSLTVANKAIGEYIYGLGKKWYFVVAGYAFGQSTYKELKAFYESKGGGESNVDEIPLGTTDYSSYLLKLRQAQPDVVVAALGGGDFTNFLKQFSEAGFCDSMKVANPFASDDYLWSLTPDAQIGLYTKVWHYDDETNPPEDVAFAKAWQEKYNKPASVEAWEGWISMRAILQAIEKSGSTEPRAIVTGIEQNTVGGYDYRDWDHQLIKTVPIMEAHPAPANDKWDVMDVVAHVPAGTANMSDVERFYGDKASVGCVMGDF